MHITIGNAKVKKTLPLEFWILRLKGPMIRGYEIGFRIGGFLTDFYFVRV